MVVDAVVDIVILEIGSVKLKMNFKSKCKRNWKIETTIVTVASPFVAVLLLVMASRVVFVVGNLKL